MFEITGTPILNLNVIKKSKFSDQRGHFLRIFCSEELITAGFVKPIKQINKSFTKKKGSVRGLHFQHPPYSEMKMVSCLSGKVFDVTVDLRRWSDTFLSWHGELLSEDNNKSLIIPEGFAHGFQTLCENCELLYLHTESYQSKYEGGLNAIDPAIGIKWPLNITELSEKDSSHQFITPDFQGIIL